MTRNARFVTVALVAGLLVGAPQRAHLAPGGQEPAPPKVTGVQEVEVVGVLIDQGTQQPTLMLQGKRDRRSLVMAIGLAEMMGIAVPLQGVTPPRPLTHDLFLTLFGRLNVRLTRVVINDFRDDIYFATVYLTAGGREMQLDARPSDAIALAIRAKVPVLVEDRVFERSGHPRPLRGPSI
jgi:bifunctional DNase/RNase